MPTAEYASAEIKHCNAPATFRAGTEEVCTRTTERGRNERNIDPLLNRLSCFSIMRVMAENKSARVGTKVYGANSVAIALPSERA